MNEALVKELNTIANALDDETIKMLTETRKNRIAFLDYQSNLLLEQRRNLKRENKDLSDIEQKIKANSRERQILGTDIVHIGKIVPYYQNKQISDENVIEYLNTFKSLLNSGIEESKLDDYQQLKDEYDALNKKVSNRDNYILTEDYIKAQLSTTKERLAIIDNKFQSGNLDRATATKLLKEGEKLDLDLKMWQGGLDAIKDGLTVYDSIEQKKDIKAKEQLESRMKAIQEQKENITKLSTIDDLVNNTINLYQARKTNNSTNVNRSRSTTKYGYRVSSNSKNRYQPGMTSAEEILGRKEMTHQPSPNYKVEKFEDIIGVPIQHYESKASDSLNEFNDILQKYYGDDILSANDNEYQTFFERRDSITRQMDDIDDLEPTIVSREDARRNREQIKNAGMHDVIPLPDMFIRREEQETQERLRRNPNQFLDDFMENENSYSNKTSKCLPIIEVRDSNIIFNKESLPKRLLDFGQKIIQLKNKIFNNYNEYNNTSRIGGHL